MGFFITFEGIEGCGKTTQIEILKIALEDLGRVVRHIREPGSTRIGERIREILLTDAGDGLMPVAELFLYEASRAQLTSEVIAPALREEVVVICDRFIDSTVAYQGYGRALDTEELKTLNAVATGGITPDLTVLLDLDPEVGLKRAHERMEGVEVLKEDRFEREEIEFHRSVRKGFLKLAALEPERISVVNAARSVIDISTEIRELVCARLPSS